MFKCPEMNFNEYLIDLFFIILKREGEAGSRLVVLQPYPE